MYTKAINRELSAIADNAKENKTAMRPGRKGITVNQALCAVLAFATALAITAVYAGWIPKDF